MRKKCGLAKPKKCVGKMILFQIVSLLLIACMLSTTAYAAPGGRGGRGQNGHGQESQDDRNNRNKPTKRQNSEQQTTESAETESVHTEDNSVMTLVEDETTVENGDMLRASTYALTSSSNTATVASVDDVDAQADASTTIKYFGVTLYDYDANTINAATMALEQDGATIYEGIYFSDGSPDSTTTIDMSAFVEGQYYIQNIRASENNVGSWLVGSDSGITSTANQSGATLWTLDIEDGNYYLKSGEYYLSIGSGENGEGLTGTKTAVTISAYTGNSDGVQLSQNDYYLCQWGSRSATAYGGYTVSNDGGNGMLFYRVDGETQTLATLEITATASYAAWNRWDKASGSNDNGQKTWTGLIEPTLDANKNIVFTKPDGGIFNDDATVKSIYTNVELPFVYENGFYIFDASVNGVYFHEDETQGSDGVAASNSRLYFHDGTTQSNSGNYGDGSSTVWAPFNDSTSFTETDMNYHFGMRATVPFTMTANGRMNETDDTSDPIQFSFSGDDDVWVFIDGQLVVDLGGIHNRLDVEIDFAANTVTYSETNTIEVETGSYNDESFELTQTLFGGLISQDRITFAATESHELTIFYLERGQGSSNAKIQFNLPMKDTVTVTKHATQSWTDDDTEEGRVSDLTATEQAIVDNIDFGFTLYKSNDGGTTFEAVANTNYNLLNANGQVISTPSTDANGHFYLKNGQSARFVTEFASSESGGVTYYVIEDSVSALGFVTPDYNYGGESAGGFSAEGVTYSVGSAIPEQVLASNANENKSYEVTVYGSDESEDSLVFICENYLDAELPNPSARPAEDKIVIDYGLDVEIDVLVNDVYRGDKIELISVTGAGVVVDSETGAVTTAGNAPIYGTAEVNNGKITYQLNKQLTGVEILSYVVKVTGETTQETTGTVTTAYEYAVGTVYIIPATTMYYEENFSDLVTYTGSGWQAEPVTESAYTNTFQEPGVVGTVDDSPYGSDVAYLKDSHDSNGTSKYASTTNGAVKFEYTFTGTGTSFYARTTNNTGYMRVDVKDSAGATIQSIYRDTVYLTEDDNATLYNIPVFTTDALDYGTYTVTVVVAKENKAVGYNGSFWLDGIRVYSPMDTIEEAAETVANWDIATGAYATDGEANMVNVTLRNKLIREADVDDNGNPVWTEGGNFVLFTDIDGKLDTAEEYVGIGPKEEVYLNDGQSVSFSLYDWDPNTNKIYLGIKAPIGTGTVIIGSTELNISNSVDCYYDITNYATVTTDADGIKTATFTIKAGEDSLISVTNIKVTGNFEFTIIAEGDVEVDGDAGSEE